MSAVATRDIDLGRSDAAFREQPISGPIRRWFLLPLSLMTLPALAVMGSYLIPVPVFGDQLFGFRLASLAISCAALVVAATSSTPAEVRATSSRRFFVLGYVWLTWGLILSFQVGNRSSALQELAGAALGFLLGFSLIVLGGAGQSGLQALRRGWIIAYLVASGVAVWEIMTGNHLVSPFIQTDRWHVFQGTYTIQSTLGNPNDYAAFLLLAAPFLVWSARAAHGLLRVTYMVMCASLVFFLLITGSGVAIAGVTAEGIVLLLLLVGRRRALRPILIGGLASYFILQSFVAISPDTVVERVTEQSSQAVGSSTSLTIRENLTLNGLWLTAHSYGLGIGPGAFQEAMGFRVAPYPTGGIVDPHDFWVEVLAQYGLIVFALLLAWLGKIWLVAWHARRQPRERWAYLAADTVLMGLAGYLFAAVANSSYSKASVNWMFLASLLVMAGALSYVPPRAEREAKFGV